MSDPRRSGRKTRTPSKFSPSVNRGSRLPVRDKSLVPVVEESSVVPSVSTPYSPGVPLGSISISSVPEFEETSLDLVNPLDFSALSLSESPSPPAPAVSLRFDFPVLTMAGHHDSLYVPLIVFRNTVFAARSIMFSVKAQRDQTIEKFHSLSAQAVPWDSLPEGHAVDMISGTLVDLLQKVIMSLDFGERGSGPDEVGSYSDAHVSFVKGTSQILRICANPVGPVAEANGILKKTANAP